MTGRRISHFEVLDKLGEGGMGVVYKARDLDLNRMVALKMPPAGVYNPVPFTSYTGWSRIRRLLRMAIGGLYLGRAETGLGSSMR